jgi:hypothetical protein
VAASDTGPSPTIAAYRARIGERIPLTFSQYRVWQLQHLYRDNAMYNLPRAFRVRGPLHPEAVRTALSGLARRHETLRSRITADADGFPFQCIAPEPSLDFGFVDLSGQSPAAAAASAERLLHEAAVAPFDLGQGPLRGRCLKLGTDDWLLLFVVHHVAADDASWRPFLSDFTALYTAAVSGGAASLPALPLSYSALARSQWQALTDERMAQAHAYWRGFFASDQGSEPGPADGEHGSVRYEILPQSISAATIAACKAAAARQGSTLFTLVLAAIARLAGRLYGEPRTLVCFATGNRGTADVQPLVGCFFTNLIVRLPGGPERDRAALLAEARDAIVRARETQDLPFELFARDLDLVATRHRRPPYKVYVSYRNSDIVTQLDLPGAHVAPVRVATGRNTREDLVFDLREHGPQAEAGLDLEWQWRDDRFVLQTIEEAASRLRSLLASFADPHRG